MRKIVLIFLQDQFSFSILHLLCKIAGAFFALTSIVSYFRIKNKIYYGQAGGKDLLGRKTIMEC